MRPNGTEGDALVRLMKRFGVPVTRENYLDLSFMGENPKEIPHEQEMDIPHHLRKPVNHEKASSKSDRPIVDHALEVLSQHSQKAKRGRP